MGDVLQLCSCAAVWLKVGVCQELHGVAAALLDASLPAACALVVLLALASDAYGRCN